MRKKRFKVWHPITDPSFGPLGRYLDKFRDELLRQGYAQSTINTKIRIAYHLNEWLYQKKLHTKDLNEKTIRKFLIYRNKSHPSSFKVYRYSLLELLNWLCEQDIVPKPVIVKCECKFDYILNEYTRYLKHDRGLSTYTVTNHVTRLRCFLSERFRKGEIQLKKLVPADINKFVFKQAKVHSLGQAKVVTAALRSFFTYLRYRGDIQVDLAASVPIVPNRPQAELPKYLSTEGVNKLLRSCDQTRPLGIRDYALLILMARLGLRRKEIVGITLDDINWEAGVITVCGKSGHKDELPIPKDVGRAIAMYLQKARPKCDTRALFVSAKAPIRKLVYISSVVKRACKRAGLSPPRQGVHLLRHSLATRMLREGAAMTEIAEILRHHSLDTTRIYAKVDLKSLREIARPWPGIRT